MPLPSLIEIIPPVRPVRATVTVPGSKSITNRALALAALAHGRTILRGALWSEDTQMMVDCLRRLNFAVETEVDPAEPGNRVISVVGQGGQIPGGGTTGQPLELFVGNAGTAARFLAALVCLGSGVYRLQGVPRMHERPQAALFDALRTLGYRIEAPGDHLPALVHGGGRRPGVCDVSVAESSQFASALLLGAHQGGWDVRVTGANDDELPYVEMTRELLKVFPPAGGTFRIEPDASSSSYFIAAGWLLSAPAQGLEPAPISVGEDPAARFSEVTVTDWPRTDWQIDTAFRRYLPLPRALSRQRDLGDSIMTAMVMAPLAAHAVTFTDLGRLRVQECERVAALRQELTKCGAEVIETGDTLTVFPGAGRLRGAEIETYGDHRVAMCFATLGLKVPGVRIQNPSCVKKTFPNFFQKLAAPPPRGLGVAIHDGRTGRSLDWEELGAE